VLKLTKVEGLFMPFVLSESRSIFGEVTSKTTVTSFFDSDWPMTALRNHVAAGSQNEAVAYIR